MADTCAAGLEGPFCQLCTEGIDGQRFFHVDASVNVSRCEPCSEGDNIFVTFAAVIATLVAVAAFFGFIWRECLPRDFRMWILHLRDVFTLHVKLKTIIGMYMIATEISRVYLVRLPDAVQQILDSLSVFTTFGFEYIFTITPLEPTSSTLLNRAIACLPVAKQYVHLKP